ncbi:2-amino-4-hydroxy-6-hydroxymethyldihydropteridine diphosphokinase [Alteromonas halophila]|uniref:2-amino-4-hydroxy-6-hydroxymethyldihydropteridine pyrophosphokinase n=1 Tax=Alteromonas halophila TaxID=516698 RepID=A0A918JL86_9ALTE|nr:2-amino-4-hydroxy-6-hydroxymethyldihydropteridine diphosphokinase [Alteromonas halophila]GGW83046.1 2-amino-4-hydroxy-6-hydroxymethyldihydropteridine diphosphokinase [Alteromonas halophila]
MNKEHVYIGLGSNLDAPQAQIARALEALDQLDDTRVLSRSSLYASKPMGPQDQPDFVNAVCLLETGYQPEAFLGELQKIENTQGRKRKSERWGARTLDLDILLFGSQTIDTPTLTVPHYGMSEREFVLVPLFEIAPSMIMHDGKPLAQWVARCNLDGLRRLPPSN